MNLSKKRRFSYFILLLFLCITQSCCTYAANSKSRSKIPTADASITYGKHSYRILSQLNPPDAKKGILIRVSSPKGKKIPLGTAGIQIRYFSTNGALLYSTHIHYCMRSAREIVFFSADKEISGVYSADIIFYIRRPNKVIPYHAGTLYSIDSKKAKNMQNIEKDDETSKGSSFGSICGITNTDKFPDFIKVRGEEGFDGYIKKDEYLEAADSFHIEELAVCDPESGELLDRFSFESIDFLLP